MGENIVNHVYWLSHWIGNLATLFSFHLWNLSAAMFPQSIKQKNVCSVSDDTIPLLW